MKYYQVLLKFRLILPTNHILDCHITSVNRVELYCGTMKEFTNLELNIRRDSLCCQEGRVYLPLLHEAPTILATLLDYQRGKEAKKFRDNIRAYNSMFAFTSLVAK